MTTFRNAISRSKTAKRNYIADQLESECDDFGGLTFRVPFDHGILNNWDVQKTVWDRVYGDKGKGLAVSERGRVWMGFKRTDARTMDADQPARDQLAPDRARLEFAKRARTLRPDRI